MFIRNEQGKFKGEITNLFKRRLGTLGLSRDKQEYLESMQQDILLILAKKINSIHPGQFFSYIDRSIKNNYSYEILAKATEEFYPETEDTTFSHLTLKINNKYALEKEFGNKWYGIYIQKPHREFVTRYYKQGIKKQTKSNNTLIKEGISEVISEHSLPLEVKYLDYNTIDEERFYIQEKPTSYLRNLFIKEGRTDWKEDEENDRNEDKFLDSNNRRTNEKKENGYDNVSMIEIEDAVKNLNHFLRLAKLSDKLKFVFLCDKFIRSPKKKSSSDKDDEQKIPKADNEEIRQKMSEIGLIDDAPIKNQLNQINNYRSNYRKIIDKCLKDVAQLPKIKYSYDDHCILIEYYKAHELCF